MLIYTKYLSHHQYILCLIYTMTIFLMISILCLRCDIGVGYISTMLALHSLFLRWCSQIRDFGLQHICGMRNLKILSVAGKKLFHNLLSLNFYDSFSHHVSDVNGWKIHSQPLIFWAKAAWKESYVLEITRGYF